MNRLTKRDGKGRAYFDDDGVLIRGANGTFHQKKDMTAQYIHDRFVALDKSINRLAAYEDALPLEHAEELAQAEKDGRLVVLPFPVKALLYEATEKGVREYEVEQFSIGVEELLIHAIDKCIWYRGGRIFGQEQIGKSVFLTREEAEAALKEREEADNAKD